MPRVAETRKTIEKILSCKKYFTWSDEEIAKWCKVSVETVKKITRDKK